MCEAHMSMQLRSGHRTGYDNRMQLRSGRLVERGNRPRDNRPRTYDPNLRDNMDDRVRWNEGPLQWTRLHEDIQIESANLLRDEFAQNNAYTDLLKKSLDAYYGCGQGIKCFGTNETTGGFFQLDMDTVKCDLYEKDMDEYIRVSMSLCPLRAMTTETDNICFVDFHVKAVPKQGKMLKLGKKSVKKCINVHDKGPVAMQWIGEDQIDKFRNLYSDDKWKCYISHCFDALGRLWHEANIRDPKIRKSILFYNRDELNVGSGMVANHRCRWIVTRTYNNIEGVYFDKDGKEVGYGGVFPARVLRTRYVVDIFTTTWSMSGKTKILGLKKRIQTDDNILLNQEVTVSVVYDFVNSYRCDDTLNNALKIVVCNMNKIPSNTDTRVFSWGFGESDNVGMWRIESNDYTKYHFNTFARNIASEWLHTNFYVMYEQKMRRNDTKCTIKEEDENAMQTDNNIAQAAKTKEVSVSKLFRDNFAFRVERSWNLVPQTVFTPTSSFMVYGSTATHVQTSVKSSSVMVNTVFGVLIDKLVSANNSAKVWEPTNMHVYQKVEAVPPEKDKNPMDSTGDQLDAAYDDMDIADVLKLASLPSFFDDSVYM